MAKDQLITILYAYRNRDAQRVRCSLQSLSEQTHLNFQIVLIDYGSESSFSEAVKQVVLSFQFARYFYAGHQGLLWSKARGLNYGITKVETPYCFISDVDVLFHPEFVAQLYQQHLKNNTFYLTDIGYLPPKYQVSNLDQFSFNELQPKHVHETFGVGLFPTAALQQVHGVDTFFHFYGSEDEDLNYRLEQNGFKRSRLEGLWLQHLWHERYPKRKDHILTQTPRLGNVLRINQRHFLLRQQKKISNYNTDLAFGFCYNQNDYKRLMKHAHSIEIPNIEAYVVHALKEALPHYQNTVVRMVVYTDAYYNTLKYQMKCLLGKQTQAYLSLKAVNDLVLTEILFSYRDHNYLYKVDDDLGSLEFIVEL